MAETLAELREFVDTGGRIFAALANKLSEPEPDTTMSDEDVPETSDRRVSAVYLENLNSFVFGTITEVLPGLFVTNDHVPATQTEVEQIEAVYGTCIMRDFATDLHFFSKTMSAQEARQAMHAYVQDEVAPVPETGTVVAFGSSVFGEPAWRGTIKGFPAGSNRMNMFDYAHQFTELDNATGVTQRKGHVERPLMGGVSGSGVFRKKSNGVDDYCVGVAKRSGTTTRDDGSLQHWGVVCLWQDIDWLSFGA